MFNLIQTKRTDPRLLQRMLNHYSKPKGFVGRNICYSVNYDGIYYGHIVGGSATLHLPGRNQHLDINKAQLNNVVNNVFFNITKVNNDYPVRNFTSQCVKEFCKVITIDWQEKYGDNVLGFETLIEKPRTGELYKKAGWELVGETIGYTCKRVGGFESSEPFTGKRIWNVDKNNLKPKLVFCHKV